MKEKGDKDAELEIIKVTTINKMWVSELNKLRNLYLEYKEERKKLMDPDSATTVKNKKKPTTKISSK